MKRIFRIVTVLIIAGCGFASGSESQNPCCAGCGKPGNLGLEAPGRMPGPRGAGILPDACNCQVSWEDRNDQTAIPADSDINNQDTDGDGIADEADPEPANPRGPPPSVSSPTASGNPLCNLIVGEVVRMVIDVNNPGGPMPAAEDLTLFVNDAGETVGIAAIGETPPSTRSFLLSWTAKTAKGYPAQTLQNLSLRFRDPQQATSWLDLARIDVAEWEGMIAGLRSGPKTAGGWELGVRSHRDGSHGDLTTISNIISGNSIWYRGPKSIPVTEVDRGNIVATAEIPDNARYPLFFISSTTGESFLVNSVIDVSDPVTYPHDQFWINNQYPEYVKVSLVPGGDKIVQPGETVCLPMAEPPGNDAVTAAFSYIMNSAKGEKMISASSIGLVSSQRESRRINMVNFLQDPRDGGRISYNGHANQLPVMVQITPHAAHTLEHPGLPIEGGYHQGSAKSARLSLGEDRQHMIVLKVGPDAAALSNGIGLWLRKGAADDAGNANPLPGFKVMILDPDGSHRHLAIPADGKLSLPAGSPDWQQLTSRKGLTLFMERDASVTETHNVSIQLLKKRDWHPKEAVRIAAIDIIPVDQVADHARDFPEFVFSTRTRAAPAVDSGVSHDYRLSEPLNH